VPAASCSCQQPALLPMLAAAAVAATTAAMTRTAQSLFSKFGDSY
jgi:hypothetical protein